MKNIDVVESWVNYCKAPYTAGLLLMPWHATANVHCSSKRLYSYGTPIAEYKDGKFYLTSHKYSVTTSKHCGLVRRSVPKADLIIVDHEIKDI